MTTPAIALALKCGLCAQFDGKIVRPDTVTPELYVRQLEGFYALAKAEILLEDSSTIYSLNPDGSLGVHSGAYVRWLLKNADGSDYWKEKHELIDGAGRSR
jgi:hypothetical protein